MFIVGQKVICINDVFVPALDALFTELPTVGRRYLVRGIAPDKSGAVYLNGIHNPSDRAGRERGFDSKRFQPV